MVSKKHCLQKSPGGGGRVFISGPWTILADISLQDLRFCVSDISEYCQHKIAILLQKLLWMQFKQLFVGDTDTMF